jgi:EAL domain-containing protein (putative c-di-GMP-specific phosphodiesterase class I)
MVQLGHSLGKVVVAEGVETARELAMLRQMECDQAQGHLFSRPKPASVIDSLLERWVAPAT